MEKFNSFYDWLVSDNSCFFGGKEIIIKEEIFNLYDNKLENNNCKHKVKILKENEKLAITKIYLECNEEK
jgi:NAD-specific glutamate dehydrogenase